MSEQFSQNKVSEAIWPWQKVTSGKKVTRPTLLFSLLTLLIAWAIGGLLLFFGHFTIAVLAFSISILVFLASRFSPATYAVIERIFQKFSGLVGTSLTWLCLVPFFYICFTTGKIAQIIKRKDPMHRTLDPEAVSYWQTCKETSSADKYKRQF